MTRIGRVRRTNCDPVAVLFLTELGAELGFDALNAVAGKPNPDATQALLDLEGPKVPVDETDGSQRTALHNATSNEAGVDRTKGRGVRVPAGFHCSGREANGKRSV